MFEAFIITMWFEIDGQLFHKRHHKIVRNCVQTVRQLQKTFDKIPIDLVAIKCDTSKTYRERKEYFNGRR
jgi:spermidine synthase|tara:strand:+ start:123 stop:332 length:210 start_codon:yes stop_codon:yes gene_type:complete